MEKFTRAQLLHIAIVGITSEELLEEFDSRYGEEVTQDVAEEVKNLQGLDDLEVVEIYHQLYLELKEENQRGK